MMQTLDLARENVALKEEVIRLRKALAELVPRNGLDDAEPSGSLVIRSPREPNDAPTAPASSAGTPIAARLILVMPRRLALDYGLSGGAPDCRVVVDRRVMERRRRVPVDYGPHERRRRNRRSDQFDARGALLVSLG